jgi:predicted metallo-beta-lactamase superfamily hydrolase
MSLNSEQAKLAARKRWDGRPHRVCEVCGREHRCYAVEAEDVEAAVRQLTGLFEKSVREIVVDRERVEEQRRVLGEAMEKAGEPSGKMRESEVKAFRRRLKG